MSENRKIALRGERLSVDETIEAVSHGAAGAVVTFLGAVRDHSEGKPVVRLDYEAYPAMAEAEMRRIVAGIEEELPGVRLAVLHRTGSLQVGDLAVVCAASAPHRGEAFLACRRLIDRIKARVPIWKREHGPDGAYWVGWQDARCGDDHDSPAPEGGAHPSPPHGHHEGHDHGHHEGHDHGHREGHDHSHREGHDHSHPGHDHSPSGSDNKG